MDPEIFTGSIGDATQAYMPPPTAVDPTQQFTGTIGDATNALSNAPANPPSLWDSIQKGLINLGNAKMGGNTLGQLGATQQPRAIPQLQAGQAPVHTPTGGGTSLLQLIFGNGGLNGK